MPDDSSHMTPDGKPGTQTGCVVVLNPPVNPVNPPAPHRVQGYVAVAVKGATAIWLSPTKTL